VIGETGPRVWHVRTRMREIVVERRLRVGAGESAPQADFAGVESLLADLATELAHGNPSVQALCDALETSLTGPRPPAFGGTTAVPLTGRAITEAQRFDLLARQARTGMLSLRALAPTFFDVAPAVEETVAAAAAQEPLETSFIGVELRGADGKPLSGKRVRIELPDGQVHEAHTALNGKAELDGLTQSGSATITLPDYDEKGYPR